MISVIVPIYNVEEYLEECLQSIQKQTYEDFECIMVNDGSPDSSAEIAQRFEDEDVRFKLITQENKGLSVARNTGLKHAKGKYITFVDSDDLIREDMLEILYRYMGDYIDIVEGELDTDFDTYRNYSATDIKILFEGKGTSILNSLVIDRKLNQEAVIKLYRKECFDEVLFPEGLQYEDTYLYLALVKKGKKIRKIDYLGYYYRPNPNSITRSPFSEKNLDFFKICDLCNELYKDDKESLALIHKFFFEVLAFQYVLFVEMDNPYIGQYERYLRYYSRTAVEVGRMLKLFKLFRFFPKLFKGIMLLYINIKKQIKIKVNGNELSEKCKG